MFILNRLHNDYKSATLMKAFVTALTLLWAARDGLSEDEITQILISKVFSGLFVGYSNSNILGIY